MHRRGQPGGNRLLRLRAGLWPGPGRGLGWGYQGPAAVGWVTGAPAADFLRAEAEALRARLEQVEAELAKAKEAVPDEES